MINILKSFGLPIMMIDKAKPLTLPEFLLLSSRNGVFSWLDCMYTIGMNAYEQH